MNYDRIILELMERVSRLEEEVSEIKNSKQVVEEETKPQKDLTKYLLVDENKAYLNNQLVLNVVRLYVDKNPTITEAELKEAFPDGLQDKLYGVFRKIEDIPANYQNRYFMDDEEIISTYFGEIAICSEWSQNSIEKFIDQAKELGFEIRPIYRRENARKEEIISFIEEAKDKAKNAGKEYIDLVALDIQSALGLTNRAPSVCNAMRRCMTTEDEVLRKTKSMGSTTFTVRYYL